MISSRLHANHKRNSLSHTLEKEILSNVFESKQNAICLLSEIIVGISWDFSLELGEWDLAFLLCFFPHFRTCQMKKRRGKMKRTLYYLSISLDVRVKKREKKKKKKKKKEKRRMTYRDSRCPFAFFFDIDALYAFLWQEKHINWCLTRIIFITAAGNIFIEKATRKRTTHYAKLKQKRNYTRSSFSCRVQFPPEKSCSHLTITSHDVVRDQIPSYYTEIY